MDITTRVKLPLSQIISSFTLLVLVLEGKGVSKKIHTTEFYLSTRKILKKKIDERKKTKKEGITNYFRKIIVRK